MSWRHMSWHLMSWRHMVWHQTHHAIICDDVMKYDVIFHAVIFYDLIFHDVKFHDVIFHEVILHDFIFHDIKDLIYGHKSWGCILAWRFVTFCLQCWGLLRQIKKKLKETKCQMFLSMSLHFWKCFVLLQGVQKFIKSLFSFLHNIERY